MTNVSRLAVVLSAAVLIGFSGTLEAAPAAEIPGRFIVVLARAAAADAVAARHGAGVDARYTHALHGFAGVVPEARLAALQKDPEVLSVEPDVVVQAFDVVVAGNSPMLTVNGETIPTGIARMGINPLSDSSAVGVAVLDTGVSLNHPDLNVAGAVSYIKGTKSGNDDNGHGSHVAGTIAAKVNGSGVRGVAPNARIFAVKVLDRSGKGSLSGVISGIDWVTRNAGAKRIHVANMSLGFQGTSQSLNTALDSSVNSGVTYVVAAGNNAMDATYFSPANHPRVITVSAIADSNGTCGGGGGATSYGSDDTFATFSNYGAPVALAAPGADILSTYKDGGYAYSSGTSMASPHVAGAAALFIAKNAGLTPADVKAGLLLTATPQAQACTVDNRGGFSGDPDSSAEPLAHSGDF